LRRGALEKIPFVDGNGRCLAEARHPRALDGNGRHPKARRGLASVRSLPSAA